MTTGASLFSDQWYRASSERPRLVDHLRFQRHQVRGETWYVLSGDNETDSLRLDQLAYAVVARFNGQWSVAEIWDQLQAHLGDAAPSHDDVLNILLMLQDRQWLELRGPADVGAIARQRERGNVRRRLQMLNPLAIRLPLFDPRRFFAPLDDLADRVYSPAGAWIWAVLVASGALGALQQHREVIEHAARFMATPRYLWLGLCVYPFMKFVHEFAHALAIRRWRGEVGSVGLTLLAFIPVPYVDASAANGFPRASQRAVVSLAGVAAELALASIGLWLWLWLDDGLPRDLAFLVCMIGGISTVAVNANPLLRFDGYFALCDLLGLPNLAGRSRVFWSELLLGHVLRWPISMPLRTAPGERAWLLAYAPLSIAYQAILAVAITAWLGSISTPIGLAAGSLFAFMLIGRPLLGVLRKLRYELLADRLRKPVQRRAAVAAGVAILALGLVPVPDSTIAPGLLWLPDHALIRAETDGFVERFTVADGAQLHAGQVVVQLSNRELAAEQERVAAHIAGLQAELFGAMQSEPARAEQARQELQHAEQEQATLAERVAGLQLRAPADGTLALPHQSDLLGTYVNRGELLGYAITAGHPVVRVAVPQEQAARIDRESPPEIRLAADPGTVLHGELVGAGGAAEQRLPSPALSTAHGGSIVTDPKDDHNQTPLAPVVIVDVQLPSTKTLRIGERGWVRFQHGWRPLAFQWLKKTGQWLQRTFNPAQ
jgi:putative peptide zinc metalloprotease protein